MTNAQVKLLADKVSKALPPDYMMQSSDIKLLLKLDREFKLYTADENIYKEALMNALKSGFSGHKAPPRLLEMLRKAKFITEEDIKILIIQPCPK